MYEQNNVERDENCNYMVVGDQFKRTGSNKEYSNNYSINCNSFYVIYMIAC